MIEYDQRVLPLSKLLTILLKTEQQLPKVKFSCTCTSNVPNPPSYGLKYVNPNATKVLEALRIEKQSVPYAGAVAFWCLK